MGAMPTSARWLGMSAPWDSAMDRSMTALGRTRLAGSSGTVPSADPASRLSRQKSDREKPSLDHGPLAVCPTDLRVRTDQDIDAQSRRAIGLNLPLPLRRLPLLVRSDPRARGSRSPLVAATA